MCESHYPNIFLKFNVINKIRDAEIAADLDVEAAKKKAIQSIAKLERDAFDEKSRQMSSAFGDLASTFQTIGSMYDKNSSQAKKMEEAAQAMIVLQKAEAVVNAVSAVAASASAPFPAGFVAMAAMAASMASLLGSIGVGFGGGSGATAPVMSTGTGTVLGDSAAVSESTQKGYDLLEEYHDLEYTELRGIHDSMKELNQNITGLVSSVIRGVDLNGFTMPEGSDGFVKNLFDKIFSFVFKIIKR